VTILLTFAVLFFSIDAYCLEENYFIFFLPFEILMGSALSPFSSESQKIFDSLLSTKELGCIIEGSTTTFRLFGPRATEVKLVLFDRYDQDRGNEYGMTYDALDGVWEYTSRDLLYGKYYGYRVSGPAGTGEMFDPSVVISDPYSKAVTIFNSYRHPAKTLILDTRYDWGNDVSLAPTNHNELIIYEAHLRDLTVHPSSGISARGTFTGMTEKGRAGGLSYLKDLGVNAIEFLPLHKFGTLELPYLDPNYRSDLGEMNTWNPYERNHWGYMTSYYFAPETYYASDGTVERNHYTGTDGRAVKEMKDMIKTLHGEGFTVLMDVVYNHVSQYDYNPFKYIDRYYYFRTDPAGNFTKNSGCGNDFFTDRPMARRLIIDSVLYWMKEYHIDGFRFDLASLIDRETCRQLTAAAKKINPNVILIAEAWSMGKYDPPGFSDIGWAAWNDQFRNGIKGQNPQNGLGFIFGKNQGSDKKKSVMNYITGTLREDGGMFMKKEHSINYLESHDDYTLGDFIRLGTGDIKETDIITNPDDHSRLTSRQLALNKLAAMFLLTSQGPVMIHEGQEFARSKVIAPTMAPDSNVGRIDHNSYEKDNETNWLNYHHKELNTELYNYYRELIRLRKMYPVFSSAPKRAIEFKSTRNEFFIAYKLKATSAFSSKSRKSFFVLLNGHSSKSSRITLPEGKWKIIADGTHISPDRPIRAVEGKIVSIPPTTGMILIKG
jgi:pullulanase